MNAPHWPVARISAWLLGFAVGLATVRSAAPALTWQHGEGYRWMELQVPAGGATGFRRTDPNANGVRFANQLATERGITNRNLLSGSGVALGDVDGDGWCDLYFCGLDGPNALYRNLGAWRFTNITDQAGVACAGQDSTGAVFADVDGDGDLDLLVHSLGNGVRIFRNDGSARFTEVTDAAGLRSTLGGMSLALADVDGDGDLDLYVVNYRTTTIMDQPKTTFTMRPVNGQPVVAFVNGVSATEPHLTNRFVFSPSGAVLELGEPDALYLNDGQGRFTPLSWTDGTFLDEDGRPLADAPRDWGLSVQMRDINGDRAPDIYVANDLFSPDHFWINDGRGRFRAIERLALRTTSVFSMGVDFGDLNRDGHVDFMIVDMLARGHKDRHTQVSQNKPAPTPIGVIDDRPQVWRNTLHLNRGDHTFAEIAFYAGVEASDWSWMPLFLDVDLDGYEDIIIPNGQMRDFQNVDMQMRIEEARAARQLTAEDIMQMVRLFPDFSTPSVIFRNRRDLTFEEMRGAWGLGEKGVSQGTACADLDNDGDLDLVMNKLGEPAGLYRNDSPAPRVAIRLRGLPPNTQGIGAKVVVQGGPVEQSQEIICGGHYLSASDPLRIFAAGSADARLRLEVTWRSGRRSVIENARANRLYEIDEAHAVPASPAPPPASPVWFSDVSERLGHRHHEDPFNDFERQPLLPHRLSQLGPGLAWHDFDEDGWEDLVVASGRGGTLGLFRNGGDGRFTRITDAALQRPTGRDLTTVLGIGSTLFVGASNYEDGRTNGGCLRIYDVARKVSGDSVLGELSSAGPLAFADFDGDGVLDLFIGGRVVPGRYPEPATSLLLRNQGGRFVVSQRLERFGLASGAVFSDLDQDGDPDLAVACEWGAIRLLRNDAGRLTDWPMRLRWQRPPPDAPDWLADLKGWWTSITAGDFDGDGRQDLVAGNWGTNHKYRRDLSFAHPRALYYGDLDESGTVDLVEAVFSPELGAEAPERGYLAVLEAMPFIRERIETFEAYGTNRLSAIYGDRLASAARVEVNFLESVLLLNRGDHFEVRPLPAEVQFSPAFGLCVGDLDGDGAEDLFVAQNFFATTVEYTRYDAGRSVLLRGDGRGHFTPVPGQKSGLRVYGEQRGAALADFDHDGRLDLAVTQNGNATKLYRNDVARPGLRVRLAGPPGNPAAIGAVLRLRFGDRFGPARELRASAGYWSQDSPVVVLATPTPPTALEIRWPGGKVTTTPLAEGTRTITVDIEGRIAGP
ncbi:MAG: VCBS repeat-containing protein [Verrucomicrobia bacterium]|nr:VCBS repeat-containing protein [Verrucomicrobiota bacterium]